MERWLSLKVQDVLQEETQSRKPRIYISVPKRVVKSAVRRNRIRRVLKEAVRHDAFFKTPKIYWLRVLATPAEVNLKEAQAMVDRLHD